MNLEALDGLVTEEFQAVAAFDKRDALSREPFELNGLHFGAILLALALALGLFVGIERALDAINGAMEQADRRPEQILEVRFEPGVAQGRDQGVKDVGNGTRDGLAFRKRSWVRLVVERAIPEELQFAQNEISR